MGVLIELVAFLEVLAPDLFWIGLLTPACFSMICVAEDLGVLASTGSIRLFEMSVFLAYLASLGISDTPPVPSCSGQTCRNRDSHLSSAEAPDASE